MCLLLVAASSFLSRPSALAQASFGTQAYAAQQQEEERWRKLSAQMEELANTTESFRIRIQTLEEENRTLRSELSRKSEGAVSPDEFTRAMKEVGDKLKELDDKRVSDNKTLREEVEKLVKSLKVPSSGGSNSSTTPVPPTPVSEEGFTHVIKDGETVSSIIGAFRAQGVKTTLSDVQRGNPGVNLNRVKVGQEIFIPKPR